MSGARSPLSLGKMYSGRDSSERGLLALMVVSRLKMGIALVVLGSVVGCGASSNKAAYPCHGLDWATCASTPSCEVSSCPLCGGSTGFLCVDRGTPLGCPAQKCPSDAASPSFDADAATDGAVNIEPPDDGLVGDARIDLPAPDDAATGQRD